MGAIVTATAGLLAGSGIMATSANASTTFLGGLTANNPIASTVPGNGDVNPYGVAVAPRSTGDPVPGDGPGSNFNNLNTTAHPTGQQGPRTTLLQGHPRATATQLPGPHGHVPRGP